MATQVRGMMVNMPTVKGNRMRLTRWIRSPPRPRRFQSMAVKKPLSKKNSGMRKPWMMLKISMSGGQASSTVGQMGMPV